MELTIIIVFAVAAVLVALLIAWPISSDPEYIDYQSLTTKEAKLDAIASARSVGELDEMWRAWSERGYSTGGQLHATLLQRKQRLGAKLSGGEKELILAADRAWQRGRGLPPIRGRRGPGTA